MKKLFLVFTVLSLVITSCQKEESEPNEANSTTSETDSTDTTSGSGGTGSTWNPFDVEHSFYVGYKVGCSECSDDDVNSMIDTISYTNKSTGDSKLIVVENQIIQYFPNDILPTYSDSVYFIGDYNGNGKISGYTRIGLENTQVGDTINVFVKFKEMGNQHMCQISQTNDFDSGDINNVGMNYKYSKEIIIY